LNTVLCLCHSESESEPDIPALIAEVQYFHTDSDTLALNAVVQYSESDALASIAELPHFDPDSQKSDLAMQCSDKMDPTPRHLCLIFLTNVCTMTFLFNYFTWALSITGCPQRGQQSVHYSNKL
jgi:hypothetical protein